MTSVNTLVAKGNTPPANTNTLWLSTRKKDLRVPHSANQHIVAITATLAWEGTAVQEPDVFYNPVLSRYEMYYSAGGTVGIGHAWATSIEGPWTKTSSAGAANLVGGYHHATYVEGSTIYLFYVDSATNLTFKVATASLSTPQTISGTTQVFSTTQSGGILMGNMCILKIGNVYRMIFEHSYNSQSWQVGVAECATITGTYALKSPTASSLHPAFTRGLGNSGAGGSKVFYENGEYVNYYHAGNRVTGGSSSPSSDIFLAVSPDCINWTILENGNPILRRATASEVDQVADPCPVDMVGGGTELFYSGISNVAGTFSIMRAHLSPQFQEFDGNNWRQIIPSVDPMSINMLLKTTQKTSAYSADNLDDVSMDPAATVNMALTLPRASVGSRVRISHTGVGAGTILIGCNASDTILAGSAATLSTGQTASYECFTQNRWNKV